MTCPSCRKRFKTGTLTCPQCVTSLLPPSMIELQDRHPELATVQPRHSGRILRDPYVELIQCNLVEAKEISRLLESEGITCLLERDEAFQYEYRIEGGSQIADQQGLILKVKADEISKARALLAWETQEEEASDPLLDEDDVSFLIRCPSCDADITGSNEICAKCGETLESQSEVTKENLYGCSVCGASPNPKDTNCPACGARFDH